MAVNRFASIPLAVLAAAASAGWIHGASTPSYPNWKAVSESHPCEKVEKIGRDVRIVGPLVVDGRPYQQHTIKDEKLIKILDERCSLPNE
jgi:hypothetical protein